MIGTVEQLRVVTLISDKVVEILDAEYCKAFDAYLCSEYPWDEGYKDIIDWDNIPGFKQTKGVQLYSNDAKEFIKSTCLSKYEYLAIVYGASKRGVVGKYDDVVNNLSNLSFHTPWIEFIVGAKKNKYGIFELVNSDFIEAWVGKCTMSAPR